jgi:alkylation response protein AidB-like acyl-CoA dehydrogenase
MDRWALRLAADATYWPREDRSFREDVWEFMLRTLPADARCGPGGGGEVEPGKEPEALAFLEQMREAGYLAYSWPVIYGGQAGPRIRQAIIAEALGYFRSPLPWHTGVDIVGPALMSYGTPAQKERWLPGISAGEIIVNNGLSEPEAGSDLAGIRTSAADCGDSYIINGHKTFQSRAHYATHTFLAARTNERPRSAGISLLMVALDSPGISIRPQYTIVSGRLNDVYFDNVHAPKSALLGEEGAGWTQLRQTLGFERSGLQVFGRLLSLFDETRGLFKARLTQREVDKAENRVARLAVAIARWRELCLRVVELQQFDMPVHGAAAEATLQGKLVGEQLGDLAIDVLGPDLLLAEDGSPGPGDTLEDMTLRNLRRVYLESRSYHARGTSEIQRDLIARHLLGLETTK